jgi:hypothetical protein
MNSFWSDHFCVCVCVGGGGGGGKRGGQLNLKNKFLFFV